MRPLVFTLLVVVVVQAPADDTKPEEGFKPLFNGSDLTGWKAKGESLDGKATAYDGRFVVTDKTIVIDPKVRGDVRIETAKNYSGDVVIRFEFKPGAGCNNDLFFRGTKFDIKKGDPKNAKDGEWNTFEIAVKGESADFSCNGEKVKTLKTKGGASPLAIRAEFGAIEFRRLRIKASD